MTHLISLRLTLLDLGWNKIGDEGAGRLAEVLGSMTALTMLGLGSNEIGDEGAGRLAGVLGSMTSLTSLDLSDNVLCGIARDGKGTYTAEGIKAVADALRVNASLTCCNLSLG